MSAVDSWCSRCGNPVYGVTGTLCDSCLDLRAGVKTYNPSGGYITGDDWADLKSGARNLFEVLSKYGLAGANSVMTTLEPDVIILPVLVQECTAELTRWLLRHPSDLSSIHPGTLENLVAEIFRSNGFDVERISSWNQPDGGVDLIAVQRVSGLVDIRVAIQCRLRRSARRVSAEPIRSLHGVLDRFGAHKGVVATSYEFSNNAWKEAAQHYWRIDLMDQQRILAALQRLGIFDQR